MDWSALLQDILTAVLIPLVGILTSYFVKFLKSKAEEIVSRSENEIFNKYVAMLSDIVCECVQATNQTYVDNLKEQDAFNVEAQREAFKKTYDAVMGILSERAKDVLSAGVNDFESYVCTLIESSVKDNKNA